MGAEARLSPKENDMLKQTLGVGAILTALAFPVAAIADEAGTMGGAAAGAVGGAVVGGPIGAVVGGVGGAAIGGAATNRPAEGRAAYIDRGDGYVYEVVPVPNRNAPSNSPYAIMPEGR
jgi:hypothetical protein